MTIDQVLMRGMKRRCVLAWDRGISLSTIATWVHAMSAFSRIVDTVEEFTGVCPPPQNRMWTCKRLVSILMPKMFSVSHSGSRNTNHSRVYLLSLHFGDENINCDKALQAGFAAMKKIEGTKFSEIHLKHKSGMSSLGSETRSVTMHNKSVCINPNHHFHNIVCTTRTEQQLSEIFKFEFSAYPLSLFD
ncbi:hypothetical protein PR048_023716 [Dryococelus australis]|uniref:Uncharacterized protein n=1 Tax=Dryococelus australis TaxID=614101 RepID=A0ABQ9GUU4_9NEOP|nr:hypothetical protein PR048_023716 [Dryococelus australis]